MKVAFQSVLMCRFAFVGAEGDGARLRSIFAGSDDELDAVLEGRRAFVDRFPVADTVVRVTYEGCSCALLKGLGQRSGTARSDAHVVGPGYAFRRGLAAATLAFGGVRLLLHSADGVERRIPRITGLGEFLRFGLMPEDELIAIVP